MGAGGVFYAAFLSRYATVFSYRIEGTEIDFKKDFDELAPAIFGIRLPQNILFLNTEGAAALLREKYPQLASVAVHKDLTEKRVEISVSARSRDIIWCAPSQCYWMDKSGIIFEEAPETAGLLIVRINDVTKEEYAFGEMPLEPQRLARILRFVEVLRAHALGWDSITLKNRQMSEVVVLLAGGAEVRFNLLSTSDKLYDAFLKIASEVNMADIDYFDLTVEDRIYYRERK